MAKGPSPMTIKARNPGKKFDKLPLLCNTSKCECDFLVSYQGSTKKRYCADHAPRIKTKAPQKMSVSEVVALLNRKVGEKSE